MDDGGPGIDVAHYARVLRGSAGLVGGLVAIVAVGATLGALGTPRLYTASALLQVEPRDPRVVDIQGVATEAVEDETRYLRTQYQILKSRTLAERVIRDHSLRQEPLLGGRPAGSDTDWSRLDDALVDRYLAAIEVEAVPGTRLIKVSFSSTDPAFAARVANAHVETFVRQGLRSRTATNQAGLDFLRERLGELKDRLRASEATLTDFRWQKGILATGEQKENLVVEQLDDVNKELGKAEAERLALEAEVRTIDTQGVEALPEVTRNTTLHELHVQLAIADSDHARVASQFKPNYPGVLELARKTDTLRRHLAAETTRVADAVRNSYRAARDREELLRTRLAEQKAQALTQKDVAAEYTILAREIETNRALYESVLHKMKEMTVAVEVRATNVSIADRAVPPSAPSGAGRMRSIGMAVLMAALAGIVLAFVRDALDQSLKSADDVELYGRLPSLGVVPRAIQLRDGDASPLRLFGGRRSGVTRAIVPVGAPDPALADAYRHIRTSLLLSRPGGPPRTILVASGLDGEGKTHTAGNLGFAFAQMGARVLVVDADLRRPTVHRLFGLVPTPGLAEVLAGQCTLAAAAVASDAHLHVLPAGATAPNPTELLGSPEMKALLAEAATRFDYVVVDSPAAFAAADAVVLSTLVEGVVLVARGHRTQRRTLQTLRARLASVRAPLVGVVLNAAADDAEPYGAYGPTIEITPTPPPGSHTARRAA